MFEIQYGSKVYDINANEKESNDFKSGSGIFSNLVNYIVAPAWKVETDPDYIPSSQDSVIKAIINPSSPFIALPRSLFKQIAGQWLESFSKHAPYCGDNFCLVMV